MKREFYPGGWYADALPTGEHCVLFPSSHVQTHVGSDPLPEDTGLGVLFLRCTAIGGFRYAGQAHTHAGHHALNYERIGGTWQPRPALYEGTSPVIYDLLGDLGMNDGSAGANGYRFVERDGTPAGRLVTGDATYLLSVGTLAEYTTLAPDLYIGQAHPDEADNAAWVEDRGQLRVLGWYDDRGVFHPEGYSTWIRGTTEGEHVALALVVRGGAAIYRGTLAELRELPLVGMTPPPKPQPPEPPDEGDFMDPWRVTITEWDPVIEAGEAFDLTATLGNGVTVRFEKTAEDSLHVTVAKDGVVQDRSGAPRIVDVVGDEDPIPVPPEPPGPEPEPEPTEAALRTHAGYYLAAPDGEAVHAGAHNPPAGSRFTFEAHGDRFAIQTDTGKYLRAENGGDGQLLADRDAPSLDVAVSDELFDVNQTEGALMIASRRGLFVAAEEGGGGLVSVNRSSGGIWEMFTPDPPMALHPVAPAVPVTALALDPDWPYFLEPSGAPFRWRGVTAFLLLKRFLTGRQADALAFLEWAVTKKRNVLRVFSQVKWDGVTSGPEPGFFAKDFPDYDERVCEMLDACLQRGVYVELVAHTFPYAVTEMIAHCKRIDALTVNYENAFYEDANEPPINGIPIDDLVDGYAPLSLASSGQYDPSPHPGRVFCNDHPPRDDEFCRKFKGAWEYWEGYGPYAPFEPKWRGPVVMDEPERIERVGNAEDWQAFAAGSALFSTGMTIHGGPWAQQCIVPTDPEILRRIDAVIAGEDAVPLQRYFDYQHPDDAGSLRRYRRRGEDGYWYEISVRPYEFFRV